MTFKIMKGAFLPGAAIISLLPCFFLFLNHRIQPDMAWLMIAAKRLMAGGSMSTDFYETNPPLSILLYVIPTLFSDHLSFLPPYLSPLFFSIIAYGLSVCAVAILVRRIEFFDLSYREYFICCYAAALMIIPLSCFGQRDHIVAMALMPFMLVQWSITQSVRIHPLLKWSVLITGSVAILLKPSCGLVPVMMLALRFYRQRRFTIVFDPDFLVLALAVCLYLAVIFIFFHDFISNILPDDLDLYIMIRAQNVTPLTMIMVFLSVGLGLFLWVMPSDSVKPRAVLFLMAAILCQLSFYVQGKGFFYHLIPFLIFFAMAASFLFFYYAASHFGRSDWKTRVFSFIAFVGCLYGLTRPPVIYPTHEDFRNSKLVKTIQEKCSSDCSFLMFNDTLEIFAPVSLYAGREYGSRFGVYWFLPAILQEQARLSESPEDIKLNESLKNHRQKYTKMIGEDFKRFKPQLVMIGECTIFDQVKHHCMVPFVQFFSADPEFRRQWSYYKPDGTITIPWKRYFDASVHGKSDSDPYTLTLYRRQI